MASPEKSDIVVRVEVQIPLGAQPLQAPRRYYYDSSDIIITTPRGAMGDKINRVRVDVMQAKFICVRGTAIRGSTPARWVFARVYAPTETPHDLPPAGTRGVVPEANGSFDFSGPFDVPAQACSPMPAQSDPEDNLLRVWADFDGDMGTKDVPFIGQTSVTTECISGSGSGSGGHFAPLAATQGGTVFTPAGLSIQLPMTLRITFGRGTGASASLTGQTIPITWAAASRQWEGTLANGSLGLRLHVAPAETQLRVQLIPEGKAASPTEVLVTPTTYQPLEASFTTPLKGVSRSKVTATLTDE
jgi:hypothetical protein